MWKANQCCGQEQFVAAQMNLKIKILKKKEAHLAMIREMNMYSFVMSRVV